MLKETEIKLVIPQDCAGLRLDQALARLLPAFSRSRLQAWIADDQVTLDGHAATDTKQKIWGGEKICITPQTDPATLAYVAENIALDIVYEDDTIIVINKPAGLVVHPGSGNWQGTMLNALLHHAPELAAVPRAGIVHRLDKNTSGLLVVAKTIPAQTHLVRQLQAHTVKRDYLTLVMGNVARDGMVDAPIGRHPTQRVKMAVVESGKEARTRYHILEHYSGCTLLRCSLETGRTHQIRVHLQSVGHALVGDQVYGARSGATLKGIPVETVKLLAQFERQALHAERLSLMHPRSGKIMTWEAPLPDDMQQLLDALRAAKRA